MKNQSRIFILACIFFSICVSALQQCSTHVQNDSDGNTLQTSANGNAEDLFE
jgi:hypothetical protein